MNNIQTEFQDEITLVKFPYNQMLLEDDDFRTKLFSEFEELEPKPQFALYRSRSITKEEWEIAIATQDDEGHNYYKRESNGEYSRDSEGKLITIYKDEFARLDAYSSEIKQKFDDLLIKNGVDKEYYGRLINDTPSVKILNEVDLHW